MRMLLSGFLLVLTILNCQLAVAKDNPKPNVNQQQLDKGLTVDFWYGGWEADYTKTAYEAMFSYRAIDKFHLMAGFGDSKQVYYDRSKIYAGTYYFYEDYSFFRVFLSERKYTYPTLTGFTSPTPDSNSYEKVPRLELEISHYFNKDLRGGLTYELSRPNFFHDKGVSTTVQKLGGELAFVTPNPKLLAKIYATLLRDPDPYKTEIRGFDNPWTAQGVAATTSVVDRST